MPSSASLRDRCASIDPPTACPVTQRGPPKPGGVIFSPTRYIEPGGQEHCHHQRRYLGAEALMSKDQGSGMAGQSRDNALDHVVVVVFENRSLDNVLGRLYGPEDGKTFEGVLGKDLSNPIPEWAEHGADRKVVPYTVATDMDSPNPDSGEEYPHTNTQLYDILSEENRFKLGEDITAPWNAPEPGQTPTMDGYVTVYISTFTAEMGRQPTYEEYTQIMTGFTPEQVPVLNGLARGFGVFDHWFCEVPSQTFMNRSFWTAATSSGTTVNAPATKWLMKNDADSIFNRLEDHGKTWKVYVAEPMQFSATAIIHY